MTPQEPLRTPCLEWWDLRSFNLRMVRKCCAFGTNLSLNSEFSIFSNTLVTWCKELTHLKKPWCWENRRWEEKGMTEDAMVGWHHQLDGHEFEQAPGVGYGQGSLVCCSPWGHRVRHDWATELTDSDSLTVALILPCLFNKVRLNIL